MAARDYQSKGKSQIREMFQQGIKKVLLWLATGGGKTFVFCDIAKDTVNNGLNVIIVVRGRKLVDQASQRLFREQVNHGVLMNQHWNYRPTATIQVCSIDTCISRNLRPKADLIIIDEAHMATSDGYKDFLAQYPDAYVIAVTATPWVDKGLRHVADAVVHPITMTELIEQGYLVPFRYFAPSEPDLSDVKVSRTTQDYVTDQLESVMIQSQLTGKIVDHWIQLAKGRPTICFCVNISHSKLMAEKFKLAGIRAEHCDSDTPDDERERAYNRLELGETEILCNVGIACTGVDIPPVSCIIMARPTKSRNLYIQQAGRGTRTFEDKFDCMILDHAGNINMHGFPTDEPEVNLDGSNPTDSYIKTTKRCEKCLVVFRGPHCPECGFIIPDAPKPKAEIKESDDVLKEIVEFDPIKNALTGLLREAKEKGRNQRWAFEKLIRKYSFEKCKPYLPNYYITEYGNRIKRAFSQSPFKGVTLK